LALLPTIDHVAEGLARVVSQYRGKPKLSAYYACFLQQVQYLEDEIQLEAAVWDLDTATGWRLDVLGARVGQARVGTTDATYRLYIKARIWANRSLGKVGDIRRICDLLLTSYNYREENTNIYIEETAGAVTYDSAYLIWQILQQAASAGIRVWFLWGPVETWFTYCDHVAAGTLDLVASPGGWNSSAGSSSAGYLSAIVSEI
jgi:hypothetical protein